jgi:EAL domain-containing protein (putative c-di-GMP-specific phosphodiesterase class I)
VIRRSIELLAVADSADVQIELLSLNVSGQSISDPAFGMDVITLLDHSGIDASRLCFEITETVIATIGNEAMQFVTAMHERGARIALDDFGVGASWLGNLKKLPVDYLKIDGEFVRDLLTDRLDNVAVRYFQELARTIGARTVAEWVESVAVRQVLAELGVDYVQGYLIHRPEPFADLLRRHTRGDPAPAEPKRG